MLAMKESGGLGE